MSKLTSIGTWRSRHWFAALGIMLAITLTPLGWIQWQQTRLLADMASNQLDSIMWQAYQAERELDRLNQTVHTTLDNLPVGDTYALQERYEIYISRVDLLRQMPRRDLIEKAADFNALEKQTQHFQAWADPIFADPDNLRQNAVLLDLQSRIGSLHPSMVDLTWNASRAVSTFVDERNRQLREQSVKILVMAVVNTAALIAFVLVLVHNVRKQQRQNRQLTQLSNELTVARDEAESANHGKSVFLANMSHEIRTPFQGLLGMLTLLAEGKLNVQQRDYLRTAQDSALHLLGILNDILDVSTMESGTLKLSPTSTPLHNTVREVESLMQVAAHEKGLRLAVEVDKDVPQWVMADATRLRQILFNLINNAIKFTNEGEVTVHCSMEPAGTPGAPKSRRRVMLTIADTGVGMDEETVEHLFTRFFQADNSLRRRHGGTGLGLEISRNLARMMGGDIHVRSTQGVGTIFTVLLDLPEAAAPANVATERELKGMLLSSDAPRLRILVAEDHPVNLKYMNILLDRMGHDAVFCSNGEEALTLLERSSFDVVLLDYHMPVLDGLATARAIRSLNGPAARIKIIMVTADVVNDTRKKAMDAGVNEFASKPLQAEDLRRALAKCGLLGDFRLTTGFGELVDAVASSHAPISLPTPLDGQDADSDEGSAATMDDRTPTHGLDSFRRFEHIEDIQASNQPEDPARLPLIDSEAYDEMLSLMPRESLRELLGSLFSAPDGTVERLMRALQTGVREDIAHESHQLKGTSMLVGFRKLARTAAEIEGLARSTDAPIHAHLAGQLSREAKDTVEAMESYDYPDTAWATN
ncbi:ATP-binding protein [Hydrogenophaga sp. 5NK40-0174]|uniref:ATP-binding protein n=1 Tax=Hydrogenophaga sp. 5NK40-0174 TaxID=3127649 RepID=UPI00310970EF